jgi:hypothetical protein
VRVGQPQPELYPRCGHHGVPHISLSIPAKY